MKKIIAVAAALALGAGAAYAQDKSATDKIQAAGEANTKARDAARDKKRAEEEARSKKNKEARDMNPPGSEIKKTAKGVQEMQEKNAKNPTPRR